MSESQSKVLDEFWEFASKGNVVDMAVGIIIGAAFGSVVTSLVDDVLMPPLGLLLGGVDFQNGFFVLTQGDPAGPYETLTLARKAGAVTLNWGLFLNAVVSFLILAAAAFSVVKAMNRIRRGPKKTQTCPECASKIPLAARRCPQCTSRLAGDDADVGSDDPAPPAPAPREPGCLCPPSPDTAQGAAEGVGWKQFIRARRECPVHGEPDA